MWWIFFHCQFKGSGFLSSTYWHQWKFSTGKTTGLWTIDYGSSYGAWFLNRLLIIVDMVRSVDWTVSWSFAKIKSACKFGKNFCDTLGFSVLSLNCNVMQQLPKCCWIAALVDHFSSTRHIGYGLIWDSSILKRFIIITSTCFQQQKDQAIRLFCSKVLKPLKSNRRINTVESIENVPEFDDIFILNK